MKMLQELRDDGFDEKIAKLCNVKDPVLGNVAVHNDCHEENWVTPTNDKDHPILIDFESFSLDYAGCDLGTLSMIWNDGVDDKLSKIEIW